MTSNEQARGRDLRTAHSAKLIRLNGAYEEWFQWELHWNDGGMVYGWEPNEADAREAVAHFGLTVGEATPCTASLTAF